MADTRTDPSIARRLARIEHLLSAIGRKLDIEIKEIHMAADELQVAFDELKAREAEAVAADAAGVEQIKKLRERIEAIPVGTTLTAADIAALANDLSAHTAELTAASA